MNENGYNLNGTGLVSSNEQAAEEIQVDEFQRINPIVAAQGRSSSPKSEENKNMFVNSQTNQIQSLQKRSSTSMSQAPVNAVFVVNE